MASDKIVCPKCGFPVRRVGQHACERFRQVIELWNRPECLTLSEMGRRAGVSRERIRQIVLLAGLSKRITVERRGRCSSCGCRATPHHLASECHRAQQVVKLYQDAQFHSLAEIGRQVRLSPEQVSAIARRAGLDRRAMATKAYWESLKTPCSRCGLLVTPGYHSPQSLPTVCPNHRHSTIDAQNSRRQPSPSGLVPAPPWFEKSCGGPP